MSWFALIIAETDSHVNIPNNYKNQTLFVLVVIVVVLVVVVVVVVEVAEIIINIQKTDPALNSS